MRTIPNKNKNQDYLDELKNVYKKYGIKRLLKYMKQKGYNDEHTLLEIAYILGLTQERVRQIEVMAIKKLKHPTIGLKLKNIKIDNFDKDLLVARSYV